MNPAEQLRQSLESLNQTLDQAAFEPDAARKDWPSQHSKLVQLKEQLEREVFQTFQSHERDWSEEDRAGARQAIAALSAEVAAVLFASGDAYAASTLVQRAVQLSPKDDLGLELGEGAHDVRRLSLLLHARWLFRHKQVVAAQKLARQLGTGRGAIAQSARTLLDAPTPLTSAPSLFTVNGVGTRMYGSRDQRDGTYIGTRYLTLLFVPVLPLDAYRVADAEGGGYYFLGKVSLAPWQRLWLRGVFGAILLGGLAWAGNSFYNTPERKVARAVSALESKLGPIHDQKAREAALSAYEELITVQQADGVSGKDLRPAVLRIAKLATQAVPDDAIFTRLDDALNALRGVRAIEAEARGGEVASYVEEQTKRWVKALGDKDSSHLYAAVRLCREARRTLPDVAHGPLWTLERDLSLKLGGTLVEEWPIEAFRAYMESDADPTALSRAGGTLLALGDHPSLTAELAPEIKAWLHAADAATAKVPQGLRDTVRERLTHASNYARDHDFTALIAEPDEAKLKEALAKYPGDQPLSVALANVYKDRGELTQAEATLAALGPIGMRTRDAQHLSAALLRERGDLAGADRILSVLLESELPRYEESREEYEDAAERLQNNLVSRAQAGTLPQEINERLTGLSDEKAQSVFGEWLMKQMEHDPGLSKQREQMSQHASVVPAALTLGMVKLERASDASGAERQGLLDSAERAFLAIQGEASGLPAYHLSLGQVYYRLGKAQQGDQEFAKVLGDKDDEATLEVARTYRDLGMESRAKELADKVYEAGGDKKEDAAILRALLAGTRDEREMWLKRCKQDVPFVKNGLLEIEAEKQYESGNYKGADQAYAKVEDSYAEAANTTSAGSNNAALAAQWRYACTGDLHHLDRTIERLNHAISISPGTAIVYGNAAPVYRERAQLATLGELLTVKALHLAGSDVEELFSVLMRGELRPKLLEALHAHPDFKKSATLARQAETLGPNQIHHYQTQTDWLAAADDVAGLQALLARAQGQKLDVNEAKQQFDDWLKGSHDAELRAGRLRTIGRLEALAKDVKKLNRPHDEAAVALLLGSEHLAMVYEADAAAHVDQAVAAFQRAVQLWPESGAEDRLADALFAQALQQAMATSQLARDAFKKTGRQLGDSLFIYSALEKPEKGIVAAFTNTAALGAMKQTRLSYLAKYPKLGSMDDYLVGRLLGEQKLMDAGLQRLREQDCQLEARIGVVLAPFSEGSKLYADMLRKLTGL